jgi:hypothetical protein
MANTSKEQAFVLTLLSVPLQDAADTSVGKVTRAQSDVLLKCIENCVCVLLQIQVLLL